MVSCQVQKIDPEVKKKLLVTIDNWIQESTPRKASRMKAEEYFTVVGTNLKELKETLSTAVNDRNRKMILLKLIDRGIRKVEREKEITRSPESVQKLYVVALKEIKAELEKL
jgi:hypothetical protein